MQLVRDILAEYEKCGSVKGVTKTIKCSPQRVCKILSTNGIIINETHRAILRLKAQGLSIDEISQETKLSAKTVSMYLPLTRQCVYGVNLTDNARRIKKMRERRRQSAKTA